MQLELIKELLKARDLLTLLIIHKTPGQDGVTQAQFDALVSKRDRITGLLNGILELGFAQGADLGAATEELRKQTKKLEAAANTAAAITRGIAIAGQILQTAAHVVTFFV
jgi:hypothetical protein